MNNSVTRNQPYNYDFSYSITPDLSKIALNTEETPFSEIASQLAESGVINSKEVIHFWNAISRQSALTKLGVQLQELIEIQFELNARRSVRDTDRQYLLREQLCGTLRQLQSMMGRQREYFTNLLVLLINLVFLRLFNNRYDNSPEPDALFHMLHWELKGQHSTNHFYETLCSDNLKKQSIRPFIQGQPLVNVNQSICLKSLQGSAAFKRMPAMVSSFAMAFNKENQSLTQNYKPNFKGFKKRENGVNPIININTTRNTTFANCLNK